MRNKAFVLFGMLLLGLLSAIPSAMAHCPLCTGAAVGGVELARYFGVDDSISGLFLGAAIISSALWFNKWLKKKVNFRFQEAVIVGVSFFLFAIPFYYAGLITNFEMVRSMPEHHSFAWLGPLGIDKLLFGMILGTLIVWLTFAISDYITERKGRVLWPYQSLSLMVGVLGMLALTLWLFTKTVSLA